MIMRTGWTPTPSFKAKMVLAVLRHQKSLARLPQNLICILTGSIV